MKVEFLLTIRCTPESRGEMIDTFGATYRHFREQIDASVASKLPIAIDPATTQIRWILNSGRWE